MGPEVCKAEEGDSPVWHASGTTLFMAPKNAPPEQTLLPRLDSKILTPSKTVTF